jgi:hypothetical protein
LIVQKQSRPLLAVINEDYPKIRLVTDNSEQDGLINYLITLLNIKVSNELEKQDLQVQMLVILDFIKSKFGFLTIPEIREAFKMYAAKDFGHKDIFRQLDTIVVSDVLNKFMTFRADNLRKYNQDKQALIQNKSMEISEQEKNQIMIDAVNKKYSEYLNTNEVEEPFNHVFKELVEIGKIKMPTTETPKIAEYYQKKLTDAHAKILREYGLKKSVDAIERNKNKAIINALINNTENQDAKAKIEIRAKKLVLIDYFNKCKNESLTKIL